MSKQKIIWSLPGIKFLINSYQVDDGGVFDWAYLDTPSSVVIVTLTKENKLLMVRQYRFILEQYTIENPAGGTEIGEDQLVAAKRELLEETGYTSDHIIELGRYYNMPSETNRWVTIFLATNATQQSLPPLDNGVEKHCDMSLEQLTFAEAESKTTSIEHSFALNLAKKHLKL